MWLRTSICIRTTWPQRSAKWLLSLQSHTLYSSLVWLLVCGDGVMACQKPPQTGEQRLEKISSDQTCSPHAHTGAGVCWPLSDEKAQCRCPTSSSSDLPDLTQNPPDLPPLVSVCVSSDHIRDYRCSVRAAQVDTVRAESVCDMISCGTVGSPAQ